MEVFELHSSQVNCLPEEQYLGYFLGGLQLEIKHHEPSSCTQIRTRILVMQYQFRKKCNCVGS